MQTIADANYRKAVLAEILGNENIARKQESFKRSEIYNKRQAPYVIQKLESEFNSATVKGMRKITSINVAKRMADKLASIYMRPPKRTFTDADGAPLNDEQMKVANDLYEDAKINTVLQRANRIKKYQTQAILQVLPLRGTIGVRVYQPHQIDVIPKEDDPECAFAYVISAYDRSNSLVSTDGTDQKIADRNDGERKASKNMRFVWWSDEHNFITDGDGTVIQTGEIADVLNPIGKMPFIDISDEKENEFWCRKGSALIDFSLDFAVLISDVANTNRMQGYAQGVVQDFKKPEEFQVGPTNWVFQQLVEGANVQPSVSFISPNADIGSSLKLLDQNLNYFLTAEGLDPKSISSTGQGQAYASGIERFLAQNEAFEASKEDIDQFRWVENEVWEYIVMWANHYAGTANSPFLDPIPSFDMESEVQVQFQGPDVIQSEADMQTAELKLVDAGIDSKVMAVMQIKGLNEQAAIEHLNKVDEHNALFAKEVVDVNAPVDESNLTDQKQVVDANAGKVADTALNGAQVTALVDVVSQVASGMIPRDSGVRVIEQAFLVSTEEAEKLIGTAGKSFVQTAQVKQQAQGAQGVQGSNGQ